MIKLFRDSNFFGICLQGHLECYKRVFMIEKKNHNQKSNHK